MPLIPFLQMLQHLIPVHSLSRRPPLRHIILYIVQYRLGQHRHILIMIMCPLCPYHFPHLTLPILPQENLSPTTLTFPPLRHYLILLPHPHTPIFPRRHPTLYISTHPTHKLAPVFYLCLSHAETAVRCSLIIG